MNRVHEFLWLLGALVAGVAAVIAAIHPVVLLAIPAVAVAWCLHKPGRILPLLFGCLLLLPATTTIQAISPSGLLLIATGLAVLAAVQRGDLSMQSQVRYVAPFLLIVLAMSVANWPGERTFQIAMRTFLFVAIIAWHVTREARYHPRDARRAAVVVLWASAPVAILSVYQRVSGTWPVIDDLASGKQYTSAAYAGRVAGTLGHPIIYGLVAATMVVVALGLRPRCWQLLLVANGAGVLLSGSRSAFLGLAAVAVVLLVKSRAAVLRPIVAYWLAVAVALVAVAVSVGAASSVFDDLQRRLDLAGDVSGAARSTRLEIGWSLVTADPVTFLFGHGANAYQTLLTSANVFGDTEANTFDNTYILFWYDYGALAVAAFVGLLAIGVLRGREPGSMIVLLFSTAIFFFDIPSWPAALGVTLLGWMLLTTPDRTQSAPSSPRHHKHFPADREASRSPIW